MNEDITIKTNSLKNSLKADIFDFFMALITFGATYILIEELLNEDFIKTAAVYILFFIVVTAYIAIKRKAFHPISLFTGGSCVITAIALALHGNYLCIPLLMFFSALYCLTLTKSNRHPAGSYLYGFDLVQNAVFTPVANLFLPLKSMVRSVKSLKKSKVNLGAFLGVLLALPVLIILVILLIESDAAFESLSTNAVDKLLNFLPHLDLNPFAVFLVLIFAPYIISVIFSFKYGVDSEKGSLLRLKIKQMRIAGNSFIGGFLGSVCLLYVVYLLSQTAYFFSAFAGKLPDGTEITLAQYARRGFFEMSTIAAINLGLIGLGVLLSKRRGEKFSNLFKGIAVFLCSFTLVLIATAMSKMLLYIGEMGLTHKRLAVSVFNGIMFLTFVFIVVRLFKKDFPYFRYILSAAIVIVTVFMLIGSDSVIGYFNTTCYLSGRHETLDMDLLCYDLNSYDAVKNLDKLVDDAKYGERAKERLGEKYYYYSKPVIFSNAGTIDELRAADFIEEKKEYSQWYVPFYKEDVYYIDNIYFYFNSDIQVTDIALHDEISSQNLSNADNTPIEKGEVFSFEVNVHPTDYTKIVITLTYSDGNNYEAFLPAKDTNFFEIYEGEDGLIAIRGIDKYVYSYDEAKDYVADHMQYRGEVEVIK